MRQELLNTDVDIEFDGWLGNRFEETDSRDRFPESLLQRSVSLDRGIDIAKYLQTIGSDWSGSSVGSTWTVHSDRGSVEHYRSFEDIPASQSRVRSRRASYDLASSGRSLALAMLRDSYKGIDMGSGSLSPQIKKLKWSFSYISSFDEFRDAKVEEERPQEKVAMAFKRPFCRSISTESSKSNDSIDVHFYRRFRSGRQSPQIKKVKKSDARMKILKVQGRMTMTATLRRLSLTIKTSP